MCVCVCVHIKYYSRITTVKLLVWIFYLVVLSRLIVMISLGINCHDL